MADNSEFSFPNDFTFGASTSSFQIEGNYRPAGAGVSIWNTFCNQPGKIHRGHTGDIACNHYRLWLEDVKLMSELNIQSYRFSISWPRILPEGSGKINQEGLDFYDQLVDSLLEKGITPFITLYHWDLPQAIQDYGGWAHRGIVKAFAEYTGIIVNKLGDRVSRWLTLNEPWVFMHHGHISGNHSPGMRDSEMAGLAYKHILLAHSRAVQTIKSIDSNLQVGHCCNFNDYQPKTDSEADHNAAARYFDYQNMLFIEPWETGQLTLAAEQAFGITKESWADDIYESLPVSSDFMGFNYYTQFLVSHDDQAFLQAHTETPEGHVTDSNWTVHPRGLSKLLQWARERYQLPIYITENGCAYNYPIEEGQVRDKLRITYLQRHLEACQEAIQNGVDLRGYYYWSFMDNFEWTHGYTKRFGLVHVDFNTQERIVKDSGYFYRDVISRHSKSIAKHTSTLNTLKG